MSELLEEYVPRVYRFALRLTQDRHAAEDLTQETFLRAWSRRLSLREPRAMCVWLFRIAVNRWQDQLRRQKFRAAQPESLDHDPLDSGATPEHAAAAKEDAERALLALDRLPPRQREVLYLCACEELRAVEIADVLGISTESVKANLSLARKKLREALPDVAAQYSQDSVR